MDRSLRSQTLVPRIQGLDITHWPPPTVNSLCYSPWYRLTLGGVGRRRVHGGDQRWRSEPCAVLRALPATKCAIRVTALFGLYEGEGVRARAVGPRSAPPRAAPLG